MKYAVVKNNEVIPISQIPELEYKSFMETNVFTLMSKKHNHCVSYFGFPYNGKIKLICCIADDEQHVIYVSSSVVNTQHTLASFTAKNFVFEKFEREIHENFGIKYKDHPWLKPVRYSFNRADKTQTISNYPFFNIDSEELHEVGVGPIHAGVIEPGHFRFICNGEQILHLEIQLGYQHRGIEHLFLEKKKLLQRTTLAESISGDCVCGHTTAFVNLWESLCNYEASHDLKYARTLALELERLAIHTGDLSAMCTDVGYQLGSSVFGRLRTPIINFFQTWCGNRLAKGLIRAGKNNYPFTDQLAKQLTALIDSYEKDFNIVVKKLFSLPTALARFEKTGVVTHEQALMIGVVGMSARMTGLNRDIRSSHSHDLYAELNYEPIIKRHGDVYSRGQIRREAIRQSISFIRRLMEMVPTENKGADHLLAPAPDSFAISLVEGWRGEICHCAITNETGELVHYKIKDPSFHNWLALALAVRNNEISDFPISNKSFDLSYCGHDL